MSDIDRCKAALGIHWDIEDARTNLNAPVDNPCLRTTLIPALFDEVIADG